MATDSSSHQEIMDRLVRLFAECREEGIVVPPDMPLDTPEHERSAVHYLSYLLFRKKHGLD